VLLVVIVVLNQQNTDQSFKVQADGSMYATVSVPAHSIHTLMFDVDLIQKRRRDQPVAER